MDKRVFIAAFIGLIFIILLVVFAIKLFIGLVSPVSRREPSPVIIPVTSPSPVTKSGTPPVISQAEVNENTKEFLMENEGFNFTVKEMEVEAYDRVRVTFKVNRGEHTWTIKEFNVSTRVLSPGEEETIEFVADRPGSYEYFSSVADQRNLGMRGRLVVR
ncbi:cupredoxin domain-containing protein [Candidatus Curtissbacteria bacterium]|nr:cupredoxin domain-containing protein [Candidatus Curtissbacteria bacterium]